MKRIKIETKYFTVTCLVDKSVYENFDLKYYTWYAMYTHNSMKIHTYIKQGKRTKVLYLHRLITNCPKGLVVDHINGNGLDNRLQNLRVCSRQENNLNIGKPNRKSSSKYIGVSFVGKHNPTNPWKATISIGNKTKNLGYFKTEKEAAMCRDKIALTNRGTFARLNFGGTNGK